MVRDLKCDISSMGSKKVFDFFFFSADALSFIIDRLIHFSP